MSDVNNFDVLKKMSADNREIWMGTDVLSVSKVKLGTQVTVGIGGDMVGLIARGEVAVCLLIFSNKHFKETKSTMETDASQ